MNILLALTVHVETVCQQPARLTRSPDVPPPLALEMIIRIRWFIKFLHRRPSLRLQVLRLRRRSGLNDHVEKQARIAFLQTFYNSGLSRKEIDEIAREHSRSSSFYDRRYRSRSRGDRRDNHRYPDRNRDDRGYHRDRHRDHRGYRDRR